jgi:glycerol-3-phosphate dehydrogenase
MINEDPESAEKLHPRLDIRAAQVFWAVRHEMARTVEDFLARRTRALLLDARASIESAPRVASLMASKLNRTPRWCKSQVEYFTGIAQNYIIG